METLRERIAVDVPTLQQVPLFAELPIDEIEYLAATLRPAVYPADTLLFHEGEVGERFYIVLDGQIAIVKALGTVDERLVGVRGQGEFVGEMSLLNQDGLRTASVLVHEQARVLELTRADFDALLYRHPTLAYCMLRVLSTRLRASNDAAIQDLHEKNRRLAQAYADLQAAQEQIIKQETLARELQLAREIQESMLPHHLPTLPGLDLAATMIPARTIGGDFYDVISLGPDRLGLVVGDVSGKGVPAALFMALTCSLLRAEASRTASIEETLRAVNAHLLSHNTRSMFVTVLFGILQRDTRQFDFIRAGHELPLILDAQGQRHQFTFGRGHPLALFPNPALDIQSVTLPPGGTLLLYTDGATEAMDIQNQQFGADRLAETMRQHPQASAKALCDQLIATLAMHQGAAPQSDDITLVMLRTE